MKRLSARRFFTRDEGPPGTSIFVRNLPESVTTEKLVEVFGKYGALRGAQPVSLKKQKEKDTFAFVDFQEPAAKQAAIAGPVTLDGQQVCAVSILKCTSPQCAGLSAYRVPRLYRTVRRKCLSSSAEVIISYKALDVYAKAASHGVSVQSALRNSMLSTGRTIIDTMSAHAAASSGEEAALHQEQGPGRPAPGARHVPWRPHRRPWLRP